MSSSALFLSPGRSDAALREYEQKAGCRIYYVFSILSFFFNQLVSDHPPPT